MHVDDGMGVMLKSVKILHEFNVVPDNIKRESCLELNGLNHDQVGLEFTPSVVVKFD